MQVSSSILSAVIVLALTVQPTGGDDQPALPMSVATPQGTEIEVTQDTELQLAQNTSSTVSTTSGDEKPLPPVFSKALPQTLAELRQIESHVTNLLPSLKACSVNLRIGQAQGSGVIVSAEGLILTAAHVAGRPGGRVRIVLPDGEELLGQTLGRNRTLDAGMVQINSDRKDWPHCELASMESIKLGDWCIAMGHPGGWDEERGLVTRLGRVIQKTKWYLQTDCELVGGDSGGPLFDMHGRLIGINTRIGEETSFNFHVPISAYHDGWDRLLTGEDYRSHSGAYLGLSGDPRPEGTGLLVTDVYRGTPAEAADIKVGDILMTLQSRQVRDIAQLARLVGEELPGDMVKVEILRDGKPITIDVRLGLRFE
ncbi:MAG: trypsin-like peptidase domain-containing protein [Planctomycetaceae bacterium]|nr:trypsin-like peptidase domain-containing protein [Planctomycetaceae bacterium]